MRPPFRLGLLFVAAAFAPLLGTGCGGSAATGDAATAETAFYNCMTETRAVAAVPGLAGRSTSHTLAVSLEGLTPETIAKSVNMMWQVKVSNGDGQPVEGAALTVTPFMPDHQHGSPRKVVVSEMGAGAYQLSPVFFFMGGYWEVTVKVTTTTGTTDELMFPVCVPG